MRNKIFFLMALVAGAVLLHADIVPTDIFEGTPTNSPPPSDKPFFVIFAVGNDEAPHPVQQYLKDIFDVNHVPSLPGYVREVTRNNINLNVKCIGTAGEAGGNCFIVTGYPSPYRKNYWCEVGFDAVKQAAQIYNFKQYADSNNTVYGALIVPTPRGNGVHIRSIKNISSPYGDFNFRLDFGCRDSLENCLAALCCHEFGHHWFDDIGYFNPSGGIYRTCGLDAQYNLGGYDVMGAGYPGMGFWETSRYVDVLPSPFNPYWRIRNGWLTPVEITNTSLNLPIEDISSGKAYIIKNPQYPLQYFILTNHQKRDVYEAHWPRKGLMIWHVYYDVNNPPPGSEIYLWKPNRTPLVDIECAHGLWDWQLNMLPDSSFDTSSYAISPNPISGYDSLDIFGIYNPPNDIYHHIIGDTSDAYPSPAGNDSFTQLSNPSSNFYYVQGEGSPESIRSGISIKNIRQPDTTQPVMYADIFIDTASLDFPPIVFPPVAILAGPPLGAKITWPKAVDKNLSGYVVYKQNGAVYDPIMTVYDTFCYDYNIFLDQTIYYTIRAFDSAGLYSEMSSRAELRVPPLLSFNENGAGGNTGRKLVVLPNGKCALSFSSEGKAIVAKFDVGMNEVSIDTLGVGQETTLDYARIPGSPTPDEFNVASAHNAPPKRFPPSLFGRAELWGYRMQWGDDGVVYPWENIWFNNLLDGGIYDRRNTVMNVSPPSVYRVKKDKAHLAWEVIQANRAVLGMNYTYWLKYSCNEWIFNPMPLTEIVYSESWFVPSLDTIIRLDSALIPRSACVTADPLGNPHITWDRNGEVYYTTKKNGVWMPPVNLSNAIQNRPAKEAFIDCYGNIVSAVWIEEYANGIGDVFIKTHDVSEPPESWTDYIIISGTLLQDSRWPQIVANNYVSWSEQTGGLNWEIIYNKLTGGTPQNVSNSPAASRYGQVCYKENGSVANLYFAWSDGDAAPYTIKAAIIEGEVQPKFIVTVGQPGSNPYTLHRDSFMTYPSGITVDYAADELSYTMPLLDSVSTYDLQIVGYHESTGEWKQMVELDGKWKHQMKVTAGKPETLKVRVPPAFVKDGSLDVKVIRKTGDYAAISKFNLYENDGSGKGGAQLAEANALTKPLPFALKQNAPNPFSDITAIQYQLPTTGKVHLSVYNIAGQLVKELVNEEKPAGEYAIKWTGRNKNGQKVSTGIYIYRLKLNDKQLTKRLMLLK